MRILYRISQNWLKDTMVNSKYVLKDNIKNNKKNRMVNI